jgi:hypothetical protein
MRSIDLRSDLLVLKLHFEPEDVVLPNFRSFVLMFVCSFVCLFVRSFVCLFICSFVCLFLRSFIRLFFVRSFVCFFICSFVRSYVCFFVPSFVFSFACKLRIQNNFKDGGRGFTYSCWKNSRVTFCRFLVRAVLYFLSITYYQYNK